MKLTTKQIIEILDNGTINKCTESEKKEVFEFSFGSEFMDSKTKGEMKTYYS